jgi:hypothetical protein
LNLSFAPSLSAASLDTRNGNPPGVLLFTTDRCDFISRLIKDLAVCQHYIWASGHFLLLLTSFRVALATALFRNISSFWYKGKRA